MHRSKMSVRTKRRPVTPPHCILSARIRTTRGALVHWASKPNHWRQAQQHYPFGAVKSASHAAHLCAHLLRHFLTTASWRPRSFVRANRYDLHVPMSDVLPMSIKRPHTPLVTLVRGLVNQKKHSCMVDFANRHVGGAYLSGGFVQEEKLVLERFEMATLLAKACAEGRPLTMNSTQVWVFRGVHKWATCDEYGSITADWKTHTRTHRTGGNPMTIIAMDALPINPAVPYTIQQISWLLAKAYTGFAAARREGQRHIATGNWGCGVFGNCPYVIFWIQCLAAYMADVHLTYYSHRVHLKPAYQQWDTWVAESNTYADIWQCIQRHLQMRNMSRCR